MYRSEIYANRSVEEDIIEEIERRIPEANYSLIEEVRGKGRSGVREGTAVWPELNVLIVLFGAREEALLIADAVAQVKQSFPREGVKLFQYEVTALGREQPIA
jgi:hypothetical protein